MTPLRNGGGGNEEVPPTITIFLDRWRLYTAPSRRSISMKAALERERERVSE